MILSRSKPAIIPSSSGDPNHRKAPQLQRGRDLPSLDDFLARRDYTGALTLLEFNAEDATTNNEDVNKWIGYCAFHLGDYRRAADVYEKLLTRNDKKDVIATYLACCYFYLGMYPEARKTLNDNPGPDAGRLRTRLELHLAFKLGDKAQLEELEDKLRSDVSVEDQLCLASVHYLRAHYQEAIDIYKKVLLENSSSSATRRIRKNKRPKDHHDDKEFLKALLLLENYNSIRDHLALNVYVALCYYKQDYYEVAQEVLEVYLQKHPDSATAINLKACNHFRNNKTTPKMIEMKQLINKVSSSSGGFGNDLIQHNMIVFRNGEGALQILPNLVDVIPEARLNLVIYYLRQNETQEAYELIKALEPSVPQEYVLKGIVFAVVGQERNSQEYIKLAQQYFQLVGTSASECDTVPGRQCMASFYFLYRQFKDVLVYLNSIKTFFSNVDSFNFNYAQAHLATGHYKEAEESFLAIRNERYRCDFTYVSLLAYCYVMNKKGQLAWELYLKMEPSTESFNLLQLIANTCYTVGDFWHAAKAFDMLERLDPSPEHWEGKRGACCGTFQYIVAEKLPKELLAEVVKILKNTSNTQAPQIIRVMRKWGKDNRIPC